MAVKFSISKSVPILVDADFIAHCTRISDEVDKVNREEIMRDAGVTEEEYDFVAKGNAIDRDSDRYFQLYDA